MNFGESLFVNFHSRLRRRFRGSKLDYVRHGRENFRGFGGRGCVDESLPRMGRVHRVGVDALARMKCFCRLGGIDLRLLCFWGRLRSTFGNLQQREIVDRAGPGELRVVKHMIRWRSHRKFRPRRKKKGYMKDRCEEDRKYRYAAF